jgi:hypothetical protein
MTLYRELSMHSPILSAQGGNSGSAAEERWSVARAAALVAMLSGGLWLAIVAVACWLIA